MSVELGERSLRIIDNQLGGRIIIFISPRSREYEIYLTDTHGRFINKFNSFKICSIYSVSYCETKYEAQSILIDVMKCKDIWFTDLIQLTRIPPELFHEYAVAKATGNYETYYRLVHETLADLREKLEKRISDLINLNFGFIMELVANYFNPPFIEYGKEVGTWITVNPLYEESRIYGRYCHNCRHPTCNDIERIIPGTSKEEAMQ